MFKLNVPLLIFILRVYFINCSYPAIAITKIKIVAIDKIIKSTNNSVTAVYQRLFQNLRLR